MLVFFKPFSKVSVMVLKFKSFSFSLTMNQTLKAGLVDTVALLAWTAASLEDGDKHSLATSVIFYLVI